MAKKKPAKGKPKQPEPKGATMFDDLFKILKKSTADVLVGDWLEVLGDTSQLTKWSYDFLKGRQSNAMHACPPQQQARVQLACDNLRSACVQAQSAPAMATAPGAVGKLFPGDGSFLKALLEIITKLLPIIAPLLSEPVVPVEG